MTDLEALVPRMRPYATTIFGEMSARANALGAVNLGQGFPDVDGPAALKDIAIAAIADGSGNQYPPAHGLPDLRAAIADHQAHHYGLTVSAESGVVVTTGASEALAAAVLSLVGVGDEVIVFEPYFDLYAAIIAMAGAQRVAVPLRTPEPGADSGFRLDV
ncbi:MAG: aminotransferase class I/II-fold pyridoxal phosphate-dependent enzyme, partial [Candidatus Nanopelagicales bacterium]